MTTAKAKPTTEKTSKATTINKSDLVRLIAAKTQTTLNQSDQFINALTETITEQLAKGNSVTLLGFGSFEVRPRAARTGRHPQSGEAIAIAATQGIGFKPGSILKKTVANAALKN